MLVSVLRCKNSATVASAMTNRGLRSPCGPVSLLMSHGQVLTRAIRQLQELYVSYVSIRQCMYTWRDKSMFAVLLQYFRHTRSTSVGCVAALPLSSGCTGSMACLVFRLLKACFSSDTERAFFSLCSRSTLCEHTLCAHSVLWPDSSVSASSVLCEESVLRELAFPH
jgi:hypothetical protein